MEIRALTTYEIATDGAGARLSFVDANGDARAVYVPVEILKLLALSMPKIMLEALEAKFHDPSLRLVHSVDAWRVERASDGKTFILTFTTPDRFSISFGIGDRDLDRLARATAVDGDPDASIQHPHFH